MASSKLKIKINNSYESEPSTGSGSSLSENNDCANSDDENMNLQYLLKPPSYQNEVTISTTKRDSQSPAANVKTPTIKELNEINEKRKFRYGVPVHSSQESPFKGFGDSPFGKIKQSMFNIYNEKPTATMQLSNENNHLPLNTEIKPSPGKLLFTKFYDTIVEENSCNARDMLLSNDAATNSSEELQTNPSSELSFNGKIKSLTNENLKIEAVDQETVSASQQQHYYIELQQEQQRQQTIETYTILDVSSSALNVSQINDSIFLKKYTNEKSPDLFGDDEDTEPEKINAQELEQRFVYNTDNTVDTIITINTAESNEATQEHESTKQNDLSSNNKSLTCPTESSFADDQTLDSTSAQLCDTESLLRANCRREKELQRRIRKCLSGIPPPPTLTIPQMDIVTMVVTHKEDIFNFHRKVDLNEQDSITQSNSTTASILKPTHTLEETKAMGWKDILGVRQHGLSFNLSKASESNEYLSLSVIDRFVGAETASSYQISPSSAKKRNARLKMLTQSPGNRLSHLAKRRAIFSSANLATTSLKSTSSLGTQILLDKKRSKHRRKGTPKRKTPGSKKKIARKTPSSSARKRLYRCDLNKTVGPSRETSKRALFQSPAKTLQEKYVVPKPVIKPEIATRVEKSKRALFSPDKLSQSSRNSSSYASFGEDSQHSNHQAQQNVYKPTVSLFGSTSSQLESLLLKRKRHAANLDDDYDDTADLTTSQSNKLFHGDTQSLTPRALKIKSESFCIGAGSSSKNNRSYSNMDRSCNVKPSATITSSKTGLSSSQLLLHRSSSSNNSFTANSKLMRAQSETIAPTNSLTENQRKKLLWAVSQALQEKKITAKHESFKHYASVLARVVRRIFQEYYQRSSSSNSETMLRLAKKYAFNVVSGRNVDDIYFNAKVHIDESKRRSTSRLSGYIGPEEYLCRKTSEQTTKQPLSKSNMLHGSLQNMYSIESSMDSFGVNISQTTGVVAMTAATSQICSIADQEVQQQHLQQQQQLPIQSNPTLQNSSSKNNLGGLALRENVDCEQRRSAQKNFTGKDQRNVSPYAAVVGGAAIRLGSGIKTQPNLVQDVHAAKAKRQILFDS